MMKRTVADVMLATLNLSGVNRVFGIPGGSLNCFTVPTRCAGTALSSGNAP